MNLTETRHQFASNGLDFDDLMFEKEYDPWKVNTLHPTPEARNPKPENRRPNPETRNPRPETRDPKPETPNPTPGARLLKLETRDPRPETQNPKSDTRHLRIDTHYPRLCQKSLNRPLLAGMRCGIRSFRMKSASLWTFSARDSSQRPPPNSRGLGYRVQGAVFRVQGPGSRVQGPGSRVQGAGCRFQGARCRAQGSGCRVQGVWGSSQRSPPSYRVQGIRVMI